jgi:hypothetical protein
VSPLSVFARSLRRSNPVTSFANDGDQKVGSGAGNLDCRAPRTGLAKTEGTRLRNGDWIAADDYILAKTEGAGKN